MEKLRKFLEDLGLGKNEVEIFIALNMTGPSSVLEIAKKTKLHRSNIYDNLRNLLSRGFIYEIEGEKKLFAARGLENLRKYLRIKQFDLDEIIKQYGHLQKKDEDKIKISKGKFAVRAALYELLNGGKEILVYGIPKEAYEIIGPMLREFHKERLKKRIIMKHIYNSEAVERVKFLNKMGFTQARVLPEKYDSYVTTNICGDKVVIFLWPEEITVIEIDDEHMAKPYKEYFEILWQKSKVV